MLDKLTQVNAHKLLPKLIEKGAVPPTSNVVATARSEDHQLQVVVMITPYEGPLHIHPDVVKHIQEMTA